MLFQPSANALGSSELVPLVIVMIPSPSPRGSLPSPHEPAFLTLPRTGSGNTGQVTAVTMGGTSSSE